MAIARYGSILSCALHSPRAEDDVKPVSMHAEMHAIFSLTGMSPSFKTQVQGMERRVSPASPPKPHTTKGPKEAAGPEGHLSGPSDAATAFGHELGIQSATLVRQL